MNPICAKLKIYTYSIAALSAVVTLLYALCYLFFFDPDLHYFLLSSPLPTIARAILVLTLLWCASAYLFLPKDALCPHTLDYSTFTVFAAALCGFVFLFFSAYGVGRHLLGIAPIPNSNFAERDMKLDLICHTVGIPTAVYFFTTLSESARKSKWTAILGFFPPIWAIIKLAQTYFDFFHPMNEPAKLQVQLGLMAAALAMLGELHIRLNVPQPQRTLIFHYLTLPLSGTIGLAGMIALLRNSVIEDYANLFPMLTVLGLYYGARTFDLIRTQLAYVPEPESVGDEESECDE